MPQELIGIDGLKRKLLQQLIYRVLHTAKLNTSHVFKSVFRINE